MIRFLPDTWRDALLRPLAMAAPDGNVYVEIMAPDFRFIFICLLSLAWLILKSRLRPATRTPLLLLALVAAAFVPWLATSGNGRYFIPFLVLAGPLAVALAYWLPASRSTRMSIALGMLAIQAFVTYDISPWRSWELTRWKEAPYFDVALPDSLVDAPATFVTITSISYSIVAPLFDRRSHWINLSGLDGSDRTSTEGKRAQQLFSQSKRLLLMVPTAPYMTADVQPSPGLQEAIDAQMGAHGLALDRTQRCEFAPSMAQARLALGNPAAASAETRAKQGFWFCPLRYPVTPRVVPKDLALEMIFNNVEHACPRFFPPGTAPTRKVADGFERSYAGVDMRLYVLDDGKVYYKYWRALAAEPIASAAEVAVEGFTMDCSQIRGRSGLPWERRL